MIDGIRRRPPWSHLRPDALPTTRPRRSRRALHPRPTVRPSKAGWFDDVARSCRNEPASTARHCERSSGCRRLPLQSSVASPLLHYPSGSQAPRSSRSRACLDVLNLRTRGRICTTNWHSVRKACDPPVAVLWPTAAIPPFTRPALMIPGQRHLTSAKIAANRSAARAPYDWKNFPSLD